VLLFIKYHADLAKLGNSVNVNLMFGYLTFAENAHFNTKTILFNAIKLNFTFKNIQAIFKKNIVFGHIASHVGKITSTFFEVVTSKKNQM